MPKSRSHLLLLLALVCLPVATSADAPSARGGVTHAAASPSPQWSWGNPTPAPDIFKVMAFGNGIYLAAGQEGALYTSSDGINWSPQSGPIKSGPGYIDGIFAGGLFVLAGANADLVVHIVSSSDGVHWTDTTAPFSCPDFACADSNIMSLSYGGSTYLAMGGDYSLTSTDGVNWTKHTSGLAVFSFPAYQSGTFVVLGEESQNLNNHYGIYSSTNNGASWQLALSVPEFLEGNFVSNGSTLLLFTTDAQDPLYASTDGRTWVSQTPTNSVSAEVTWNGTQFVTWGRNPAGSFSVYTSTDGSHWTQGGAVTGPAPSVASIPLLAPVSQHALAFTGTGYVAVGGAPLTLVQSPDYAAWTSSFSGASGPGVVSNDLLFAGGRFIAAGHTQANKANFAAIMESADGAKWNEVYSGTINTDISALAYGNGVYVAVGSPWLYSTDGSNWTTILGQAGTGHIAYGNGMFVVTQGDSVSTSRDGRSWTTQALSSSLVAATDERVLGYNGTRFVIVGDTVQGPSSGTNPVFTSCDAVNWTNSAALTLVQGASAVFMRLRLLGNNLVAAGSYSPFPTPHDGEETDFPIATALPDATTVAISGGHGLLDEGVGMEDIAFDGVTYYGLEGPAQGVWLTTSNDLQNWTDSSSDPFPVNASATWLAAGNNRLVAGGAGDLLYTAATGSASTKPSSPCTSLPSIAGTGGGGGLGLLTLGGLLGLAVLRRRLATGRG